MSILSRTAQALQGLLGPLAEEVARQVPVVRRRRKFTPASLAQTFVLGFLARPRASDEDLARVAARCGVPVTPQAVEQRFTPTLARFLEALFRKAVAVRLRGERTLAPLLERFPAVILQDSTSIPLPDELSERFPGCGGSFGRGRAAMKLQVQLDLKDGSLPAVSVEAGKDCDQRTPLQAAPLPEGGLRIADLGYFDTKVFRAMRQQKASWISRLSFNTEIFTAEGQPIGGIEELFGPGEAVADRPILLAKGAKIACRVVAWRVPEEVANRRRQKLIASARDKGEPPPSGERLRWCDWAIFVTDVPADRLSPREIQVLYRARWQIELMFKRWKSLGRISDPGGSSVARRMVRLWSRLLAMVVQNWLLVGCVWGDRRCSLHKACLTICDLAPQLASSLPDLGRLTEELAGLGRILGKLCRSDKRKRPSTFDLLNDPSLLDYVT
jgi:hypothetical protein